MRALREFLIIEAARPS